MKYTTHNKEKISFIGTSYLGQINVRYNTLVNLFGNPQKYDDYKTDAQWVIKFINDDIATIYNYKNGLNYLGNNGIKKEHIIEWNVGGNSKKVLLRIFNLITNNK